MQDRFHNVALHTRIKQHPTFLMESMTELKPLGHPDQKLKNIFKVDISGIFQTCIKELELPIRSHQCTHVLKNVKMISIHLKLRLIHKK